MAGAAKGWTKKKRTQWINRMTKFLFDGDNASFEREVSALRKGSPKKSDLRTSGNYLLKHSRAGRMNYAAARRDKLPIGSGVIEYDSPGGQFAIEGSKRLLEGKYGE